jgi:hypothetical protein
MILGNYINDLLYRYDCVIVPDFGGFITNRIGAKVNKFTHTFSPPTKQVTFNNLLKHNDGLLANYIASSENISFEKASSAISLSVIRWKNELQSKPVEIENLGSLSLTDDKKLIFEPSTHVNYLTESFGLKTIESSAITRYKEQIKPLISVQEKEDHKKIPAFIKYAATAAILLTLGITGLKQYQNNQQSEVFASQEKEIQNKIQSATFVISNPLPTISLNVIKEEAKTFHLIAGAFQFKENAKNKVKQLKAKGFDSKIIGTNKWGLTQVSFNSYSTRNEATNDLYKIRKTISKDAWLLIKKRN